jgi:hypothetical protein
MLSAVDEVRLHAHVRANMQAVHDPRIRTHACHACPYECTSCRTEPPAHGQRTEAWQHMAMPSPHTHAMLSHLHGQLKHARQLGSASGSLQKRHTDVWIDCVEGWAGGR